MESAEQHRTFLFIDELNAGNRNSPTACHVTRQTDPLGSLVTLTGPGGAPRPGSAGRPFLLIGGEEHEPAAPEYEEHPSGMIVIDPRVISRRMNPGPGPSIQADVLTFPDFKDRTVVSWQGQNFLWEATEWEREFSIFATHDPAARFTPVLDECGLVVGYYMKAADTKDLWVAEDAGIFFYKSFYASVHDLLPGWVPQAKRLGSHEVFLTSEDQSVSWTEGSHQLTPEALAKMFHVNIGSGSRADILVDVDGCVLSIDLYDNPLPGAPRSSLGPLYTVVLVFELIDKADQKMLEFLSKNLGELGLVIYVALQFTGGGAGKIIARGAGQVRKLFRTARIASRFKAAAAKRVRAGVLAARLAMASPKPVRLARLRGARRFRGIEIHQNVQGTPDTSVIAHAHREIHQANRFAVRQDVTTVYLGEVAKARYKSPKAEKFPDVVAERIDKTYMLGEGKGTDLNKAIAQFEKAGERLGKGKITELEVTVPKLQTQFVDGRQIRSPGPGFSVDANGFLLRDSGGTTELVKIIDKRLPIKIVVMP